MAPSDSRATDGAGVLAGDGRFVVYARAGGFSLRLPAGSFRAEWYDPRSGSFTPVATTAGGTRRFQPPSSEDWVLYLRSAAVQR
jgi:Putative collagen-binding domain of a collagenase